MSPTNDTPDSNAAEPSPEGAASEQPCDRGAPERRGGRYRFRPGRPTDLDGGLPPGPEQEPGSNPTQEPSATGIPNSPQELIAMQEPRSERPEKPERKPSAKVTQILDLIESLDTTAAEDQRIALALVRHLESFHDEMVEELKDDPEARHSQIVSWAIDGDRLYRCRMLLESVDLE